MADKETLKRLRDNVAMLARKTNRSKAETEKLAQLQNLVGCLFSLVW
jgi:hypothetical protein